PVLEATPSECEEIRALPALESALAAALKKQALEKLTTDTVSNASWIVQAAERVLIPGSEPLKEIRKLFEVAEAADHHSASGDHRALRLVIEKEESSAARAILLSRSVRLLHRVAQASLDGGDATESILLLAEIPPETRTDVTRKLAADALVKLQGGVAPLLALESSKVLELAIWVEESDAGVKEILVGLFANRALEAVRKNDGAEASRAFVEVVKRRPDPNDLNDELRFQFAMGADGGSARAFSLGRVEELKRTGALTLSRKFRLLTQGYFGWFVPLLFIVSFCTLIVSLSLLATRRVSGSFRVPIPSLSGIRSKLNSRASKRNDPGYLAPTEKSDEYSELLSYFGLEDSSSEAQIKKAYRSAIKAYHPDHFTSGTPESEAAADKFRRMQDAYDRIMQIRSSWFGGRYDRG
ncbi:MAG: J domain-containing protein, partial [Deltaproteobacteria bacterium]|nr:J domain-containing protein [Deltaproteobacteria bacterium]